MERLYNKKIKDSVRNFLASMETKDIEKTLSFFTEDAVLVAPRYSLTGVKKLKEYLNWLLVEMDDLAFIDEGIGIMVKGEKIVYQHILIATIDGRRVQIPSILIFMCNKNKFSHIWISSDWHDPIIKTDVKNIMQMGWNRDYSNL